MRAYGHARNLPIRSFWSGAKNLRCRETGGHIRKTIIHSSFLRGTGEEGEALIATPHALHPPAALVYDWCMTRTNVDIDDSACAEVMRRYRLATKREAVNLALRLLAAEPASIEEARALRGVGWEGNLDAMRSNRSP